LFHPFHPFKEQNLLNAVNAAVAAAVAGETAAREQHAAKDDALEALLLPQAVEQLPQVHHQFLGLGRHAPGDRVGVVALDVSGTLSGNLAGRKIARIQPGGSRSTSVWGVQLAGGRCTPSTS